MPRIASWDILSRPYGTGPYPRSYPGLTSWATLSRPCGTEYWIGRVSHRLFRAVLPRRAGAGTFGGRPSTPRIHGDFAVSFLSQLVAGKLASLGMTKGGW